MDTGLKISELNEFTIGEDTQNKIFLVLEPTDNGTLNYKDRFITYQNLKKQLFSEFSEYVGFKDMVFEQASSYSKIDHSHVQYNNLSVNPNSDMDDYDTIATIQIDGQTQKIRKNYQDPEYVNRVEIGELKFVATDTMNCNIDIYSEDFDGWVYANGKKYRTNLAEDFQDAKENFIVGDGGMSFTVPYLGYFIKPSLEPISCSGGYTSFVHSNSMQNIPYHEHVASIYPSGQIQTEMETTTTLAYDGKGKYLSRGSDSGATKNVQVASTTHYDSLGIYSVETMEEGVDSGQKYPTHNEIPIMIYIGKRT